MSDEPYDVKSVEVIAKGEGFVARAFIYAPGEGSPWHRHSVVTDIACCVTGALVVQTAAGELVLHPGDRSVTPPGEVHRVLNRGAEDCRMILIQHGGRYDFVTVAAPS